MKYFQGEIFTLEKKEEAKVIMSDDEINAKYKKGEVRIVTEQARYPVKSIKTMIDSGDYILNPEYQRRNRWDNKRKSRLIESFIMNVPLPPVFLYESEYSKFEVMDGQQRLTAVFDFYSNNFSLEGLEYWKELEGKKYNELPEEIQKGIDRRYISSVVLLKETAKTEKEAEKLKQIVFERLNNGGVKLTAQETRNALYNGQFNQLCLELSKNESFRKMWKIPLQEKKRLENEDFRKMYDVELVLRFFAFSFIDKFSGINIEEFEDFLDEYLKQANKFPHSTLCKLRNLFTETVETIHQLFGEKAFFPIYGELKKPLEIIYDPLMQVVRKNIDKRYLLLKNQEEIRNRCREKPIKTGSKIFQGSEFDKSLLKARVAHFEDLLQTFIK